MLAIDWQLGRHVTSDRLIQAALDGALAGLDTPSLNQLVGLTRREEPDASDLFARVLDELDLTVSLPADTPARGGNSCAGCASRSSPAPASRGRRATDLVGGLEQTRLPTALRPIVGWVSDWEDWASGWNVPGDTYTDRIIDTARQLLAHAGHPNTPWKHCRSGLPARSAWRFIRRAAGVDGIL